MKVNFVKTFIPVKDFVAVEKVGNKILVRFDAVKDSDMDAYSCVEGSVSASEYNEQEMRREYEAWKQKWAEKALTLAKKAKIAEIVDYDKSPAVNSFYLNGEQHWLDFNLRDRVFDGNERIAYKGREETSLWLDGKCFVMPIAAAQDLICTIEVYAKDCYNVTATHQAEVNKLTTIEEVEAYDYKTGYPEKLNLKV